MLVASEVGRYLVTEITLRASHWDEVIGQR
jgi:hypothetical protein